MVKMFTQVIKDAYTQLIPGASLPDDADELEDELFQLLPKPCSVKLSANNVVTEITIL